MFCNYKANEKIHNSDFSFTSNAITSNAVIQVQHFLKPYLFICLFKLRQYGFNSFFLLKLKAWKFK